jgi:hypothetical protein
LRYEEDTMNNPTNDLAARVALLHCRYSVVFPTATVAPANPDHLEIAEALVQGLRREEPDAVARVRGAVDPADLYSSGFWTTPLGRLLFAAGGYGAAEYESIGQSFAAGVLGTSRQWVGELLRTGRLERSPSSNVMVTAASVRELLKAKIDSLVK